MRAAWIGVEVRAAIVAEFGESAVAEETAKMPPAIAAEAPAIHESNSIEWSPPMGAPGLEATRSAQAQMPRRRPCPRLPAASVPAAT